MSMPAQKIRPAREEYDKMTDSFFKKRLQRIIKPQKEVLMDKTLKKYHDEQKKQEEVAFKEMKEVQQKEVEAKGQKRKAELNKLQRNAGFMDEWLEKGLKEWRVNILKKKKRENEDEKFKFKQAEMTLTKLRTVKQEVKEEVYGEIKSFEKRVSQTPQRKSEAPIAGTSDDELAGESLGVSPEGTPAMSTKYLQGQKMAAVPKESKYKQGPYNKEREQRRRKMLMDQGKMQREVEARRREEDLIEKMNRLSRQEQELEYEAWRTTQCKAVVTENRKLREARYHKREDLDTEVAMIREEEALTALKSQLEHSEMIETERAELYTVARKQSKRNSNAIACQEFLNLIFDLSDEAFKHQQTIDTSDMDPRNWREWTQLFVDKLPMAANSPNTYAEVKAGAALPDEKLEIANSRIDYLELLDYLRSAYQWERKVAQGEDVKLVNNFELGNAVRSLINLNYPPQKQADRSRLTLEVKLKLSIIGFAYGGKKTQAQMLSGKHGIAVLKIEELISEALKEIEEKGEDVDIPSKEEHETKKDDPELKKIAYSVREDLMQGREVSDLHCIQLIMHKLRLLFGFMTGGEYYAKTKQELAKKVPAILPAPEKPVGKFVEAIKVEEEKFSGEVKVEEVKKIAEEVKKETEVKKEVEVKQELPQPSAEDKKEDQEIKVVDKEPSNEEELEEMPPPPIEESELNPQQVKGFVLVDFPSTLSQAKLLEEALSGYVCYEDREVEAKHKLLSESEVLAKPTPIPEPQKELIPSGLDAVLWLKTPKEECIRRAFGLKKDVKNDATYHILNNPPPTTNNDIVEKLQSAPDAELLNAILTDRHISFEMAASALMKWLQQFGDAKRGMCLLQEVLATVPGNGNLPGGESAQSVHEVHKNISGTIAKVLSARNEEEQNFINGITQKIQQEVNKEAAQLDFERRYMAFEDELAKQLAELEKKKAAPEEEAEEEAKEEKKIEPKQPLLPPELPRVEIAKPVQSIEIEDEFKRKSYTRNNIAVLLNMWTSSSRAYTENVKKNMRFVRQQRYQFSVISFIESS